MAKAYLDTVQRQPLHHLADKVLTTAMGFWFLVAAAGQLAFAFYIASVYGAVAGRGDIKLLNRFMTHGYVAGDTPGNAAVIVHLAAAVILLAGVVQLIPRIQRAGDVQLRRKRAQQLRLPADSRE